MVCSWQLSSLRQEKIRFCAWLSLFPWHSASFSPRYRYHRILVIAPLRVARDTWPAEIKKWQHLKHLTFAVCVGTPKERKAALMAGADITIINRENLQWLIESSGFPFDYNMVVIDELSSFKNHNSKIVKIIIPE